MLKCSRSIQLSLVLKLAGVCLLFTASCLNAQAQKRWADGTVSFKDGTEQSGKLYYKSESEELAVWTDEGTHSYKAEAINSFQISSKDSLFNFYSLPFDLNQENSPITFFQLLKALPDFWLLSRATAEDVASPAGGRATIVSSFRSEMLFFLTNSGKIELFSAETRTSLLKGRTAISAKENMLRELMYPFYDQVADYASQVQLSFTKKSELVRLLDYYEVLAR